MAPSLYCNIPGASIRFAINWTFTVERLKTIKMHYNSNTYTSTKRFRLPWIGKLGFSLELSHEGDHYKLCVQPYPNQTVFLEDVLILVDGCVYRAECTPTNTIGRLVFNRAVLYENLFENDEVTFHCFISIPVEVEKHRYTYTERTIVKLTELKQNEYDAVREFEYSSRIPDFNVKMAKSLLEKAHLRGNLMLKALCAEYLMENLTFENVTEVMKLAANFNANHLVQKCSDFIAKECKVVPIS